MKEDQLRDQVNAIIRDEIQEGINEYIETQEESEKTGLGFVSNKDAVSYTHLTLPTKA
mgnify:CR=1 FL=1